MLYSDTETKTNFLYILMNCLLNKVINVLLNWSNTKYLYVFLYEKYFQNWKMLAGIKICHTFM